MESFTCTLQTMIGAQEDFLEKFKQRVVNEFSNLTNPAKFLEELINAGVLSDDSSDTDVSEVFKEMIVQYAMTKVCSKGSDAIRGLMKALEKSGNLQLISALRTWETENFATGITQAGFQSRPDYGAAAVHIVASKQLSKNQLRSSMESESSSVGPKVLDNILSYMEDDIIRELEDFWVRKASKMVNVPTLWFSLARQNVLSTTDIQRATRQQGQEELWATRAIKAACSKKAMGSLVFAFQNSGNECILEETLEWIETVHASGKNCPIKVRRLAINLIEGGLDRVNLAFLEQLPPLHDLQEFAKFVNLPESSTTRKFNLEFDKDSMVACVTGWGVTLWNWRANEAKKIELGVRVHHVTCMQSDEEILVLGTAEGSVHLFDSKRIKQKCVIGLGDYDPVHSLKFAGSTLVVLTRCANADHIWWVDISRSEMQLLNERLEIYAGSKSILGFFVRPEYTLWYKRSLVYVSSKKSGRLTTLSLDPPADTSTLSVVELVSTKSYVVAGCKNGVIAMWSTNELNKYRSPLRRICGHNVTVVSLCAINGHLLSLDQSGKLFMWSGFDLEDEYAKPVPLVVAENAANVTILVANGRWFGSSSSKDDTGSSGTLPSLCLRRR